MDINVNGEENGYASRLPNRKYGYFRDDQITFLVTHDTAISEEQLQGLAKAITERPELLRGGILKNDLPQAIPFPKFTDQEIEQSKALLSPDEAIKHGQDLLSTDELERSKGAFSVIQWDLEHTPDDPAELLGIVDDLNKQFPPEQGPIAGLTVQGASLNWLASVASNGSGTGGPGGKPSPYYGSRKNAPYLFDIKDQLEGRLFLSSYDLLSGNEWQPRIPSPIISVATFLDPGIDAVHKRVSDSPGQVLRPAD